MNGNRIVDTNGDAIRLEVITAPLNVNNNIIGRLGPAPIDYIVGNGIYIKDAATGGNVMGNIIRHTQSAVGDDASGIYLVDSNLMQVGGFVPGESNIIRGADWNGIKIAGGENNLIAGNDVRRSAQAGIHGENTGFLSVTGNTVHNSNDLSYGGITIIGGNDISIAGNSVSDNLNSDASSGIYMALVSGVNEIRDNIINAINGDGVRLLESNDFSLRNNIVTNVDGDGIYAQGMTGKTVIARNVIGGAASTIQGNGIHISGSDEVRLRNNAIENADVRGLYVSGPDMGRIVARGNIFTDNPIGAEFESGRIVLKDGNVFNNGLVGIRFAPLDIGGGNFAPMSLRDVDGEPDSIFPAEPTNYGGSIGAQVFNGQSLYYIELANNAFFKGGVPMWIDGTNSTYDGITPSLTSGLLSEADFNAIESKIFHYTDQPNLGVFWFGFFEPPIAPPAPTTTALIAQEDIFNVFGAFNGDVTGLNVRITGLPRIPGAPNAAAALNNIQTFAGGNNPANLNEIETAAGEGVQVTASATEASQNPADIEPASGGEEASCWGDAMNIAGSGQAVNVVYQGTMADSLNQAAACGTSF